MMTFGALVGLYLALSASMNRIVLDDKGFEVWQGSVRRNGLHLRWANVTGLKIKTIAGARGPIRLVHCEFRGGRDDSGMPARTVRDSPLRMFETDGNTVLANPIGQPDALVRLMTLWREQALGQP